MGAPLVFKVCAMCYTKKPISLFRPAKGYRNGIFFRCRQCESDTSTAWYHRNKERAKAQRRAFKKEHPELEYQRTKSWRALQEALPDVNFAEHITQSYCQGYVSIITDPK